MDKKTNKKGFYKTGRLTFKEYRDGRKVLFALGSVEDETFQKYICKCDRITDGKLSAQHVLSKMAVMAFRHGLRLPGTEKFISDGENNGNN